MNFEIDESFLTDVTVVTYHNFYQNKDNLTDDELLQALKYANTCKSISKDDHAEFKVLRNQLEAQGYIKTERSWWNGDTVLQSFTLNGARFKKNEQFPSGAAIKFTVQSKLRKI